MSMKMGLEIWKWRFPWPLAFSAPRLEMIFSSLVEIKECAISNVQLVHPLRGTAFAGRRRPVQAVGGPALEMAAPEPISALLARARHSAPGCESR